MDRDDQVRANTKDMLALVGEAISEWSFVEQTLCSVLTICVTSCPAKPEKEGTTYTLDGEVTTAIFYSVENFRGKLKMVDAALRTRVRDHEDWGKAVLADWGKLHVKVRNLSLKRNRLAHWTVTPAWHRDEEFVEAALMPPYGSPMWWKETGSMPAGNALSTKQVDDIVIAFSAIHRKLKEFYENLARQQGLW